MCQETAVSIIPRIIAVLLGETVPWTGNEIQARIESGDGPCDIHFHEALRELILHGKLVSDEDSLDPMLTVTTRCRLAYRLAPETKAASVILQKSTTAAATPATPTSPFPPPPPVAPALPSPAVRRELIGRLRGDKARIEREWDERFGAGCFQNGTAQFMKALFLKARVNGMLPRLRDALEKSKGRRVDEFERSCENLLMLNDRDGTIPAVTIDSGVRLDLMYYIAIDLDRAERDLGEDREGNPANARELLAFLKNAFDDPALLRAATAKPSPPPPPDLPPASTGLAQELPLILPADPPPKKPATAPIPAADPLIGSVFGPYKVVRLIGQGGMGTVYEGLDETLDRRVALKVLHPQFADNREYQERFLREARNAANAKLDHPNITQIYSAGRQGRHLWLAMQFVRGRNLSQLLEERKKLPAGEALRIVRQVAEGLSVAHQAGMIHRDIKPDNLMIEESGRMKIMDFGLMRSVDVNKDGLTQDGLFVGTLEYASPEQCQDKPMDARTDLYSLGVVLYELLSGARPYKARKPLAYLAIIPDPKQLPIPLYQKVPELPAEVVSLVHRLIAKQPDERPATAEALIQEIDRTQPGSVPPKPAAPKPSTASSPVRAALISIAAWLLALAAAIGAGIWFWPKEESKISRELPPPAPAPRPDAEKEASDLLPRIGDDAVLETLLTAHAGTQAGARAAAQVLADFERSIPAGEAFELVSASAWGTWDVDGRDSEGASAALDKSGASYVLNAPSSKAQVRLLKKMRGVERGYRVRWNCGAGAGDSAAFMVAISFARWFEISPTGLTLFRADKDGGEDKVTAARRVKFPERVSGGVLHVFPRAGLVLVYLNDRLLLALPAREYALGDGLQLGMSGGSLTLESLRVLGR